MKPPKEKPPIAGAAGGTTSRPGAYPSGAAASTGGEITPFIPAAFCDRWLTAAQFRVLCQISRRGDRCFESVPSMARCCRLQEKTVRTVLAFLLGERLLTACAASGKPTIYRIAPISSWPPLPNGTTSPERVRSRTAGDPSPRTAGDPTQKRGDEGSELRIRTKGKPPRQLSPTEQIEFGRELDEVKAELKVIRGTYGGMQTWADDDIARHKVLKARKLELMAMLGRAV